MLSGDRDRDRWRSADVDGAVIAASELHSVSGDTLTLTSAESGGGHRDIQVMVGSRPIVADLQAALPL